MFLIALPLTDILFISLLSSPTWSESSDRERLDVNNGILLSPTYDALFDKHLISFADDGKIIISDRIRDELKTLSVDESVRIQVNDEMKFYLERHRSKLR